MKRIFLSLTILIIVNCAFAQPVSMRPNWTYNTPKAEDVTYGYYVSKGVGNTEKEARNDAFIIAVKEAQSRVGIGANSTEIINAFQSGKNFNVVASHYEIPMQEVCNFSEKNGDQWYYYQLLQIAISGNIIPKFKHFEGDCYDFSKAIELLKILKYEKKVRNGKVGKKVSSSENDGKNDKIIEEKSLLSTIEQTSPINIQINFQDYQVLPDDLDDTYTWSDAKSACDNLTAFGKSDWYLPSKEELAGLYKHKNEIGGFADKEYWSSTGGQNSNSHYHYYQSFSGGGQGTGSNPRNVRCIRKK